MTLYRMQAVLAHKSGLPRDHVVNTFHVEVLTDTAANVQGALGAIADFYRLDPLVASSTRPRAFLGSQIADAGHEMRAYPIAVADGTNLDGPEAPPRYTLGFALTGRAVPDQSAPSEVAVCLSYKATAFTDVPPARRRGRIYVGPVEAQAGIMGPDANGVPRVHENVRSGVLAAATDVVTALAPFSAEWGIYSRPFAGRIGAVKDNGDPKPNLPARSGSWRPIDEFWVDDTFDTQRRRGEATVTRSISVLP